MRYLLPILFIFNCIYSQSDVPVTLRAQFNGSFGYTIIGNTHNESDNYQFTPPPPCQMLTQSSSTLNLLPNQNIIAAYLYWGGIGDGTFNPIVQLNNISYSATQTFVSDPFGIGDNNYFNSFSDVTNQVLNSGNGSYILSNFNLNPIIGNYCSNSIYNSGWHLIIIYNQPTLPNVQLNIYDGNNCVSEFFNNGVTPINIGNLNIVSTQNAKMSYVALNGSPNLFLNESILFNGNILSNILNPPNNPFNGTNSFTGSTTNWNQDIDTFDISPFITVGDTQANITMKSVFSRFIQTVVTSIRSELPDVTVQVTQVTGQEVCNNRNLVVNYTVSNINSNAILPANVPVSFYANNVLLQTINTPSAVAIGGSLALNTTVAIPPSVPNTFTLKVIVDNTATNTSTVAESNETNNEFSQNVTLLGNTVNPVFSLANTFCQGAIVPTLPLISNNGISGTWLPNVISNQTSGSYVFTPNTGSCGLPFTLNVTISNSINPFFSIGTTFCQGVIVPTLPLVSNNGISGTWLPNVISNQTSGNYVFTPNAGSCGLPFTLNVTITSSINPNFSIATTFCQGAIVPTLPLISNNGISGTWLPNVISNQTSGSYVFTPNTGSCGLPFTLNVTISNAINPTFSIANTFCQGAIVPTLPLLSTNGISGTWLPNVISNQNSGSYVFTPNAGSCGLPFTLNIMISPNVNPTFSLPTTFCQGASVPTLPLISNNNISGTWLPNVISNQTSGSYVFAPNIGSCGLPFTLNVTIETPNVIEEKLFICEDANGIAVFPVSLNTQLNSGNYTFSWSENGNSLANNLSSLTAFSEGTYEVVASPVVSGCVILFRFEVLPLQPITVNIEVPKADFEANPTIVVNASGGSGQYIYSFNDSSFQSNPVFYATDGGTISVVVKDANGCYTFSQTIVIWHYPRFFTPNNDGYNDTWGINSKKQIRIEIFDRYGKLIKQLLNNERWDGTFNTQILPSTDYWFVVHYDENKAYKSHFSLKR